MTPGFQRHARLVFAKCTNWRSGPAGKISGTNGSRSVDKQSGSIPVKIIETGEEAYQHVLGRRARSVLVPTMGALHRGPQELIRVGRGQASNDRELAVGLSV